MSNLARADNNSGYLQPTTDPHGIAIEVYRELPTQLQTNATLQELTQLAMTQQWDQLSHILDQAQNITLTDARQYHHTDNRQYSYHDNRSYKTQRSTHHHLHGHASVFWVLALGSVLAIAFLKSLPTRIEGLTHENPRPIEQVN